MNRIEVTVLACTSCGAPLPFGDADTLVCAHCSASVTVPEEHRALRTAEHEYNLHRTAAQALLRKLGKPPSAFVRFLTDAHGGTVIWLVTVGVLVAGVLGAGFFSLAARLSIALFRVDIDDVVLYRYDPSALFVIVQYFFLFAGLGSLIVLGAYARKRGAGLRQLQAGLSAGPPHRSGGPATCRVCGAPLTAKSGDAAVTCLYCRADNLLRIPESWIGSAREKARRLAGAVEEAAHEFREEEREIRRSLLVRLVVVSLVSTSFLLLFVGVTDAARLEFTTETPYRRVEGGLYRFDWKESVGSPGFVLDVGDSKGCRGIGCMLLLSRLPCAEREHPKPLVVPRGSCDADVCTMHYYVALRRGDTIELTVDSPPPRSFITLRSHVRNTPFHTDPIAWAAQVPGAFEWLTDGGTARVTAPHDGWFQLMFALGQAIPDTPVSVCARLDRPVE